MKKIFSFFFAVMCAVMLSVPAFAAEDCEHTGGWIEGQCVECGFFCTHVWESGSCTICHKTCYHSNMDNSVCLDCGFVCNHVWQLGQCVTCFMPCPHATWTVPAESPTSRVCGDCGAEQSYCEGCFGSFVDGYCPTCDPAPAKPGSDILFSVTAIVTSAVEWVGDFVAAIVANPLLLAFVVVAFVGLGVGLIQRIKRL